MISNAKFSMAALAVVVSAGPSMVLAEEKTEGFVEGSSLTVLNRNYYFNREHRTANQARRGMVIPKPGRTVSLASSSPDLLRVLSVSVLTHLP